MCFVDYYKNNPKFQQSLIGQLIQLTIQRSTNSKAPIPPHLFDFFCLIHNFDPKTAKFVSDQFNGPSIRTIVRQAKKSTSFATSIHIVQRQREHIIQIFLQHIKLLFNENENFSFSSSIDTAKAAKALQIDLRHNAILGGAYPRHFLQNIVNDEDANVQDLGNDDPIRLLLSTFLCEAFLFSRMN